MTEKTIVHLLRHGEVHNPGGVLYGRRAGFHLSDLGRRMADRVAEQVGDRDIVHMRTSPLERARETGAPLAARRGVEMFVDPRVVESSNVFEGISFGETFYPGTLRAADAQPVEARLGQERTNVDFGLQATADLDSRQDPEVVPVALQQPS